MSFTFQPTGEQHMGQREVDAFLQEARMSRTRKNPQVLQINIAAMQKARNNGYPVDMYHPHLEMRQALKEEEEQALAEVGYQRAYIPQEFPKYIYRRNMADKYAEKQDVSCPTILNNAFIEDRLVKDADAEKALKAQKPPAGCSVWFDRLADVPPLAESEYIDPAAKIAQLEGALEELRRQNDNKQARKSA
jgi:hypothetical protein